MSSSQSPPARRGKRPRSDRPRGPGLAQLYGHLTDRDLHLLDMLAVHRVLTATMVADLAFGSARHARERLATLARYDVLSRFRRRLATGSQAWRYTLGINGAVIMAYRRGEKPPTPFAVRRQIEALATSPKLGHDLGVNEFFTRLIGAGHRSGFRCELIDWLSEARCAQFCGSLVGPDGYGEWRDGDHRVRFFLEYDTGSERPVGRLVAKLARYRDLAVALEEPVLVLFWLPGAQREENVRRALTGSAQPAVHIATATSTAGLPHERIWSPAGASTRCTLAELSISPRTIPPEGSM